MELEVVSANNIKPEDLFFLAGALYRVFSVFSEPQGPVKIKFTGHRVRPNEETEFIYELHVDRYTAFQILR